MNPEITILKLVSPDNGTTWIDPDASPGPAISSNINPQFKFIVTNTGDVTLTDIRVSDNKYGAVTIPKTTLTPGESLEAIITIPWQQGQHTNVVGAYGTFEGEEYSDISICYYFGTNPEVKVEKYVSPDKGVTWIHSDTTPGPAIPACNDPQFKYFITNMGNSVLTDLTLEDDVYGSITLPATTLEAGMSMEAYITIPWKSGEFCNTATVKGTLNGLQVIDSDTIYHIGANPVIRVIKYVSPDNGLTWIDADSTPGPTIPSNIDPQFKFAISNIGNAPFTNVTLVDDVYGPITLPSSNLAIGASYDVIITKPWQNGQHTNNATITGNVYGQDFTDVGIANYFGENETCHIHVVKSVSPDNGTTWIEAPNAPGPFIPSNIEPKFKFTITNTGSTAYTNVILLDNVFGDITLPSTTINAGQTIEAIITKPWQDGAHQNTATVKGTTEGHECTNTSVLHYTGIKVALQIVKYVSVDNGLTWSDANTPPGPLLPIGTIPHFKYVITNTGMGIIENITVTDNVLGLIGTIEELVPGQSQEFLVPTP